MTYRFIQYEKRERIGLIALNRPDLMNALPPPLMEELDEVWADYMSAGDIWVAILTGAGMRAFSAGSNLKYRATEADDATIRRPRLGTTHILESCWKPIIAAVNDCAVGGGMELALCCDIIIAADHAQFGLPEARRGLLAYAGGVI